MLILNPKMTLLYCLLQGATLGLVAGATPGTLQAYLITETLAGGWRRSLPLIFVPIASDTPIIILTVFILDQLPAVALRVISIIGGLFVLYLAWGFWAQWRKTKAAVEAEARPPTDKQPHSFGKAAAMNLLNPNPYIYWTFVIGPLLISAISESWLHAILFMVGFYGIFMGTMIGFIAIFHLTRRLGPRVVRGIQLVSILIMVVFGGILLREGIFP